MFSTTDKPCGSEQKNHYKENILFHSYKFRSMQIWQFCNNNVRYFLKLFKIPKLMW